MVLAEPNWTRPNWTRLSWRANSPFSAG